MSHLFHFPWQLKIPAHASTQISPIWLQLIGCPQSHDYKTTIKQISLISVISNRTVNPNQTCKVFLMHLSCQSPIQLSNIKKSMQSCFIK